MPAVLGSPRRRLTRRMPSARGSVRSMRIASGFTMTTRSKAWRPSSATEVEQRTRFSTARISFITSILSLTISSRCVPPGRSSSRVAQSSGENGCGMKSVTPAMTPRVPVARYVNARGSPQPPARVADAGQRIAILRQEVDREQRTDAGHVRAAMPRAPQYCMPLQRSTCVRTRVAQRRVVFDVDDEPRLARSPGGRRAARSKAVGGGRRRRNLAVDQAHLGRRRFALERERREDLVGARPVPRPCSARALARRRSAASAAAGSPTRAPGARRRHVRAAGWRAARCRPRHADSTRRSCSCRRWISRSRWCSASVRWLSSSM